MAGNDPATPDVSLEYDRLGRKKSESNTLATTTYAYDLDQDGTVDFPRTLDRKQDGLNRDTGWLLQGSPGVPPASFTNAQATYTYHPATGRLHTVTDGIDTFTYGYTANTTNLLRKGLERASPD